ncbi:gamma-glutamylcyclotransferase family protein [Devosia limi]|uniref:Putative gamma-glutamylcyclotransferase n=1 Tax=Devosia limi DSM 17137 TaxID=1121477 RepID=A0A1M5G1F7_9HYPH|nr:gamma-glutamylcyclotransferase family protein [Devosia limi]SHF97595.1 Gamma-glutamyl cyclotransferase, AIG2-like [Devosia limi DSM 17137]
MSAEPLFAYGTLRDGDILAGVLGRRLAPGAIRPAKAPGYRAVYCPGQVYPGLALAPDSAAPGLVLDSLTPDDIAILDAFEGPLYRRATISVVTGTGSVVVSAYLPVTPAPADADADADAWSLEHWTLHHKPAALTPELRIAARARHDRLGAGPRQN